VRAAKLRDSLLCPLGAELGSGFAEDGGALGQSRQSRFSRVVWYCGTGGLSHGKRNQAVPSLTVGVRSEISRVDRKAPPSARRLGTVNGRRLKPTLQAEARATTERGFTLIELMISITLVAALATGMLMAMRTSLLSLEKIDSRLQFNRRVMGMERILTRQIGGVMPVMSDCGAGRIPIFLGTADALRLVSSYSMAEGARGYPQFDEFRVVKGDEGLRLVVTEHPYTSPSSTAPFCGGEQSLLPSDVTPSSLILADRLATCTFSYREALTDAPPSAKWLASWDKADLPAAVKIEMTPLDSSPALLPVMNVTVPIRITRQVRSWYDDLK
jgi:prepilin-type N-terminal cleavage/methylation domain-containing protein